LCDLFWNRQKKLSLQELLGPSLARRVAVYGVAQGPWTPDNWWHYRQGIPHVFNAYLDLGHTWLRTHPFAPNAFFDRIIAAMISLVLYPDARLLHAAQMPRQADFALDLRGGTETRLFGAARLFRD
jgi:hypothetical protein